ncbi:MAG: cyclodeaminase/cyclohydrolase family protein [Solirubrobacterales bacterium]
MGTQGVGALGGPLAARAIADAANLLEVAAQASRDRWEEAGGAAVQAASLRRRAEELGGVDAEAHAAAVDALRRRAELDPQHRDEEIARALADAAAPPLELAQLAADVAVLGAEIAQRCDPNLRPDAVAACLLAEASGRGAAHLLEINLAVTAEDERLSAAQAGLRAGRTAAERALGGD